jgi:formate-dependent nitrite reductase membrane component NrfD
VSETVGYYGRPVIKEPVWLPSVPVYFFTGGIAGGCAVIHGLAELDGRRELARAALLVGAAADMVSPALLVSDLGRPERFLNMFRVFKVTSPLSVGSWVLAVSGGASGTAAALELLGILKPVKRAAETLSFFAGPPLATYTGALLGTTAIPVWHDARRELPILFGASAMATAGAATVLFVDRREAGPARRVAIGAAAATIAVSAAMRRRLGFVGEVYDQGDAGRYGRIARACSGAGAALLLVGGRRSRTAAVAGSALVLAGGLALRWSVFRAGFQSARDPRYTILPQRERLERRAARNG